MGGPTETRESTRFEPRIHEIQFANLRRPARDSSTKVGCWRGRVIKVGPHHHRCPIESPAPVTGEPLHQVDPTSAESVRSTTGRQCRHAGRLRRPTIADADQKARCRLLVRQGQPEGRFTVPPGISDQLADDDEGILAQGTLSDGFTHQATSDGCGAGIGWQFGVHAHAHTIGRPSDMCTHGTRTVTAPRARSGPLGSASRPRHPDSSAVSSRMSLWDTWLPSPIRRVGWPRPRPW